MTGSSQGIGLAIATALARAEASVVLTGRDPGRLDGAADQRRHRPQSLLQRLIEPEEIADMCGYLASPPASATTGGALRVDGGSVDAILP
ncbi:SDR family oxidoreductase [Modestobacter altitudinis]|uniref:SDR family oxidoreductase n=1 Tax=Modestobacter altitudinis TaxID=2213158 RepID=UPI00110CD88E|nr:SDR family oxidoreductase [Modestobacter altitudinis]